MKAPLSLADRTILVTGASSGLGRHFARLLVQKGAKVAAGARRTELLEALAVELKDSPGSLFPVALDVTSQASINDALDAVESAFGPVDALVNNAGLATQGRALEFSEADYDQMFDTNTRGNFFMAQACVRRMIDHGIEGTIINIASVSGSTQMPQLTVYGMSKAAVIQMTKSLAREWGRFGIAVNAICPGYIATELNRDFFASDSGAQLVSRLPRKRVGQPEDLDAPLLMLLSGAGVRLITGAIINVDDGYALG